MSKDFLNAGYADAHGASHQKITWRPRFLPDFNMFRLTEYYLSLCNERNIRIPDGILKGCRP